MNFDSETIEVRENGVAFLSYGPWRTSLLQGVTLRSLRGRAGRPFDMNRQSAHSRNGPAENWKTFAGSIAGGRYLVVGMEQVHSNVIRSVSPSAENCRCHDRHATAWSPIGRMSC
jgi:copper oxidase (laccase) domain-containing protein